MGLLSEYAEICVTGANVKHLMNLGYIPPLKKSSEKHYKLTGKRYVIDKKKKIIVKTSDLLPNSSACVEVECDCCHKIMNKKYSLYVTSNHDGKYYCKNCSGAILNSKENNPNWKSDKSQQERQDKRNSFEYVNFIRKVLDRDSYTCQLCGHKTTNLEVHHLDGFDWCREKRTDVTNGICLCSICHANFHNKYGRGNNTKEQFEEWFGKSLNVSGFNSELYLTRKIYCYEDDLIFDSAKECARYLKIKYKNYSNIYDVCNHKKNAHTICGKHLFWLDEYKDMSLEEINYYITKKKVRIKVICITTGEIFDSIYAAKIKYGKVNIEKCCKKECEYAGKLQDGTLLRWEYY